MVFAAHDYSYFFDPVRGAWTRAQQPNPFRSNMYVTTLCTTRQGVVAWAEHVSYATSLFLLDAKGPDVEQDAAQGKTAASLRGLPRHGL